jgi:hypothetical protein
MGWLSNLFGDDDDLADRIIALTSPEARAAAVDRARNDREDDETDRTAIRQVNELRSGARVK